MEQYETVHGYWMEAGRVRLLDEGWEGETVHGYWMKAGRVRQSMATG